MITQNQFKKEPQVLLNYALRRHIELFEAEAWHDLYASASLPVREKLGMSLISLGNIKASVIPAVDIMALNRIIGAGLLRPLKPEMLEVLKGYLLATGVKRFFLQLHPESIPRNITEILNENSFYKYNNWVKFYRNDKYAEYQNKILSVISAGSKDKYIFSEILLSAFGWPACLNEWIAGSVGRKKWRHYLAYDGNKPAGTGISYINGRFAWLGFASTLQEHRGKGIQKAMLARRINDCIQEGVKIIIIETSENLPDKPSFSNRNVIKAGFNIAYNRPNYMYKSM